MSPSLEYYLFIGTYQMNTFFKSLVLVTGLSLVASTASATPFTYQVDTFNPPVGSNVEIGGTAGDADVTISYDASTELLQFDATFFANAASSVADFFFFTITDGAVPATGINSAQTTIFVDLLNGFVSGNQYNPIDGAVDPTIAAAAGPLVFSPFSGPNAVVSKSVSSTPTSTTVSLTLASSVLPGVSFDSQIGLWLQYFGLDFSQVSYNADGSLRTLTPDINSVGGYSFIDVADGVSNAEVPEPSSVALLLMGIAGMVGLRRRA